MQKKENSKDKSTEMENNEKKEIGLPIALDNIKLEEINKGDNNSGPLDIGKMQQNDSVNNPLLNGPVIKKEISFDKNISCTLNIDQGYKVNYEDFIGLDNDTLDTEEKLIQVKELVLKMHPMQKLPNGDYKSFPVCKTNTDKIKCCTRKNIISDLSGLGLGIVAYFQSLKAMTVLFLCLTIINIPLIMIYLSNHTEKQIMSYQDVLFKTTIGNIGSFLFNCESIDLSNNSDDIIPINFKCASYKLSSILSFGPSSNREAIQSNKENCQHFLSMMKLDISPVCDFNKTISDKVNEANCFEKSECNIEISLNKLKEQNSCIKPNEIFYLSYTCYDKNVKIFTYNISRSLFPFIAISIDLFGMIFLLIVIITSSCSHRISKKYFRENLIQISDYTLRFMDLNLKSENLDQEISDFIEFLQKLLVSENSKEKMKIMDEDPDHLIFDVAYPIVTDSRLNLVKDANKLHKKGTASEENIEQMRAKIKSSLTEQPFVNELFVTFTNQTYKNHLKKEYSRGKCKRCSLICSCKKERIAHLYYKDKWLQIDKIPEQPSNIIWENITYSPAKRCCRKVFTITIAILILLLPFGLAVGSNYLNSEMNKYFNSNLDCSKVDKATEEEILTEILDSSITQRNKIKTYCYCYGKALESFSTLEEIMIKDVYPCKDWKISYAKSLASSVGIICVVPIFNVIFCLLLELVTECERNKTVSTQYKILMIRTFVLQLLNTAIILILINMLIISVKSSVEYFPFFTGQFQDMDPDWYSTVGSSIIYCMILNIITPHCAPILLCLWRRCRICCDKCSSKPTKCKTRKEYMSIYIGPQFNISWRYATILTTISVILIFSSGMPILYFCCFLFMFLTYWFDKFLLLKYYQLPPNTDLYLDSFMNVTLYFIILFHLGFGIWTYGNEKILSNTPLAVFAGIEEKLKELLKFGGGISDAYYGKAFNRILFSHNIIMLIFMALIVIIMIWRFIFWKVFKQKGDEKIKTASIYESMKLECLYSNYNTRRALYRKARKSNAKYLKHEFFDWRIDREKQIIIAKVQDVFNARIDLNEVMNATETIESLKQNFNKNMPKVMKYLQETDIKRKEIKKSKSKNEIQKTLSEIRRDALKKIGRDYTYHITENPKYQDFAYYYIFAKDKPQGDDDIIEKIEKSQSEKINLQLK